MSLTKQYGFIHQTVIVIVLSLIRICYLSKFGKFGRCQMGKVSFTNEVVIAISSHQKKKKKKTLVVAIIESVTWISYISKFGKRFYIVN